MTERQKRQLRVFLGILLAGLVAGVVYNLGAGNTHPFGYVVGATYGLLTAFGVGLFEAGASQGAGRRWLRKQPFSVSLLLRSGVYAITILIVNGLSLGNMVWGLPPDRSQAWVSVVYSVGVSLAINFVLEVSFLVGGTTLLSYATGRYHRPREETRFILYVDVVGSTGASQRLGNLAFHGFLNEVFRVASEPVLDARGAIYQYVGDEMVISWPVAVGAVDARPLRCFLAIRAALARREARFLSRFGMPAKVRGSLHAGSVIVGEIGDIKRDIVFHGEVMNIGARLEEASRSIEGGFVVSADARDLTGPAAVELLVPVGSLMLRGKSDPVEAYGLAAI